MKENFLLTSELSVELYKNTAGNLAIIDYHNHLNTDDIKNNRRFSDITELWISPDPYKARAMRICGVDESYITGDKDNYSKFIKWCEVLPQLAGNPLYIWSEMELAKIFGINEPLNLGNADQVWQKTGKMLRCDAYSNNGILDRFNIRYSSPCCIITDDVQFFVNKDNLAPSLRGDNMVNIGKDIIDALSNITNIAVVDTETFFKAVSVRLDSFAEAGCKFCDHALDGGFRYASDDGNNEARFAKILKGEQLDDASSLALSSYILKKLASLYSRHSMTMLLHIGAVRRTSDILADKAGPAGGYAAIGSPCDMDSVIRLLRDAEAETLPRTVLFTLNPADAAVMSVISGSFSEDGVKAKIQQGPAWWWCDHAYGIRNVLEAVNSYGVLSTFIGMTTDSRSILSFVRHDYFRRILCSFIADKVKVGEMPDDRALLDEMIYKMCYNNAADLIK